MSANKTEKKGERTVIKNKHCKAGKEGAYFKAIKTLKISEKKTAKKTIERSQMNFKEISEKWSDRSRSIKNCWVLST